MITGLTTTSNGSVRVLGKDPRRDQRVFARMALVPDEDAVYDDMTARRFIRYAAQLSNKDSSPEVVTDALDEVGMLDAADRPIAGYSKGMRQRTKVAAALVTGPDVLILDEPLNGTDPVQRAHLIELFQGLGNNGCTVIMSSHVLEEVERVSTRVIAIVDGRLAAAGSVDAIRAAMYDIPYSVRIETDKPRELGAAMFTAGIVDSVEATPTSVDVHTSDLKTLGSETPRFAIEIDARLTGFHPQDASLESVFRYLVERR
jgi:ABC-2 type transport system ATP-binding protein